MKIHDTKFIQAGVVFHSAVVSFSHIWGLEGVWRTAPVADACSAVLTALFIIPE
jgi:hypothetical protein